MKVLLASAAVLFSVTATDADGSDFASRLTRADALYADAEPEKALDELAAAERLARGDAERVQVWLRRGAVLAYLSNPTAASAEFERALAIDADASLPVPAAPKVRAEFERLRSTARAVKARLLADRRAEPELAAAPPSRASRWLVPLLLGAGALAASAVGVGLGFSSRDAVGRAQQAMWAQDKELWRLQAQGRATAANVSYAIAGALAVTALVVLVLAW